MALFQGLFLLFMGVILWVITCQSISKGWLPFGSNGFRVRLEIKKATNPTGFWIVFCLYALAASGIIIYAVLIMLGLCPSLSLRGK